MYTIHSKDVHKLVDLNKMKSQAVLLDRSHTVRKHIYICTLTNYSTMFPRVLCKKQTNNKQTKQNNPKYNNKNQQKGKQTNK